MVHVHRLDAQQKSLALQEAQQTLLDTKSVAHLQGLELDRLRDHQHLMEESSNRSVSLSVRPTASSLV